MSNITIGKPAIRELRNGMKYATDAVRLSYGPKGMNAIIGHEFRPFHIVANDCDSIVQAIQCTDPVEKIGLEMLKELSAKANSDSADGRKTTLIIADTILEEALKANVSGIELKRELDALIPIIENEINKQKKEITENEVEAVATIAGESEIVGRLLASIYKRIGKNGIIIPESSGTFETTTSFIEGVRFIDTGYLSPFMSTEKGKAVYENPIVLVTKTKIEKDSEIEPLVQTAINKSKALIIFCDDMDTGVAQRLIATHRANVAKILIIKAPILWKNYVYEDFAKVTGATIIEPASGLNFKNIELEHLGTCGRIEVGKEETVIMPSVDYSDHLKALQEENTNDAKLRLSWLQTKTCILKLGANNESELSYFRLKVADAINSSRLALKDGIVKGGGICLAQVANRLPKTEVGKLLWAALNSPYIQLLKNSDLPLFPVQEDAIGFGDNVVDAALVVKNAVRNAISLASTVLTAGIVIHLPNKPKDNDKNAFPMPTM